MDPKDKELKEDEKENQNEKIGLLKKGNELFAQRSYKAALLYFDDALVLDQDNAKIWDIRGVALSRIGLLDEAQESFEVALDLEPDNAQAWSNLGVLYASRARFDEAINSFDHSLELEKDNDGTWNNRGSALFGLKKYKEALESFTKATELNPDNAQAWAGKGSAHNFLDEYPEAIGALERFIQLASATFSPQVEEAWALIFELKMKVAENRPTE